MKSKIIELIAIVKSDEAIRFRLDGSSHLINDAGLDSLQIINLILLIEREFGVEVDFDSFEIEHLASIDSFAGFVGSLPKI